MKHVTVALLLLAACAPENAPTPAPRSAAPRSAAPSTDRLLGRWIGVEGMMLTIAAGSAPGHYMLDMQWDLDHRGTFAGIADGDAIRFERGGVRETLCATDGAATGLKYLAGKRDCLTVKIGEGYCRA